MLTVLGETDKDWANLNNSKRGIRLGTELTTLFEVLHMREFCWY